MILYALPFVCYALPRIQHPWVARAVQACGERLHLRKLKYALIAACVLLALVLAKWCAECIATIAAAVAAWLARDAPHGAVGAQQKYFRVREVGADWRTERSSSPVVYRALVYADGIPSGDLLREIGCLLHRAGAAAVNRVTLEPRGAHDAAPPTYIELDPRRIAQSLSPVANDAVLHVEAATSILVDVDVHPACASARRSRFANTVASICGSAALWGAAALLGGCLLAVLILRRSSRSSGVVGSGQQRQSGAGAVDDAAGGRVVAPHEIPQASTCCYVWQRGWLWDGWGRCRVETTQLGLVIRVQWQAMSALTPHDVDAGGDVAQAAESTADVFIPVGAIVQEVHYAAPDATLKPCALLSNRRGQQQLLHFPSSAEHRQWAGRGGILSQLSCDVRTFDTTEVDAVCVEYQHYRGTCRYVLCAGADGIAVLHGATPVLYFTMDQLEYCTGVDDTDAAGGARDQYTLRTLCFDTQHGELLPHVTFTPRCPQASAFWRHFLADCAVQCDAAAAEHPAGSATDAEVVGGIATHVCRGVARFGSTGMAPEDVPLAAVAVDTRTSVLTYEPLPLACSAMCRRCGGAGVGWPFAAHGAGMASLFRGGGTLTIVDAEASPCGRWVDIRTTAGEYALTPLHEDHACIWQCALSRGLAIADPLVVPRSIDATAATSPGADGDSSAWVLLTGFPRPTAPAPSPDHQPPRGDE